MALSTAGTGRRQQGLETHLCLEPTGFFLLILLICFADSLHEQMRTSNGRHLHQHLERWRKTKDNDKWSSHTGMMNVGLEMHVS